MDEGQFDRPVRIALGKVGIAQNVTSTEQAAKILLDKWPSEGGRRHLAARKACLAVLQGIKEARHAREAFAMAAEEADILLPTLKPVPESKPPKLWRKPRYTLKRDR